MEIEGFLRRMSQEIVKKFDISEIDENRSKRNISGQITNKIQELERDPKSREKALNDISWQFFNQSEVDKENQNSLNTKQTPHNKKGKKLLENQAEGVETNPQTNTPPKKPIKAIKSEFDEYCDSIEYLERLLKYQEQICEKSFSLHKFSHIKDFNL